MSTPSESRTIFREKAVEKISSPDQIDKLLVVMTPKGWIALICLFVFIGAVLVWALMGRIPVTVEGKGIILTSRGVFDIVAPARGVVDKIFIRSGDWVSEKTAVASINGTIVYSFAPGKILGLYHKEGDWVEVGNRLAWTQYPLGKEDTHLCYAYFPINEGEKILSGMQARLGLEDVNIGKYGYLLGKVIDVSQYPVDDKTMFNRFNNSQIVSILKGGESGVIRVLIQLDVDPQVPSGYRWTTSKGPPQYVTAGTICNVRIVTESRSPFSYLFPSTEPSKETIEGPNPDRFPDDKS